MLVFERFLARMQQLAGDAVVVKGGLVLETRLGRARTTKDVDLRMMGTQAELLDRLQAAGRLDLGDFMRFEVQRDRQRSEIRGEGMKYAGHRFADECRLAGKTRVVVSASTSASATRWSASRMQWSATDYSTSQGSSPRACTSVRSSPTSR